MDLGIRGRRALVLAAGGGLGEAAAIALAQEGCDLILADRVAAPIEALRDRLSGTGVDVRTQRCDLGLPEEREALAAAVSAGGHCVDILINITGGPPPAAATAVALADWRAHAEAMVFSVIDLTSRLLPAMRARGWGRIVTSTSSGVVQPIPNLGVSNTLRAALVTWSKTLATEVAADGVTANVVVPGRIKTRRVDELDRQAAARRGVTPDDIVRESLATIPAGRYGAPEEFGSLIAFLASARASYITGSVQRVDGGLIRCP